MDTTSSASVCFVGSNPWIGGLRGASSSSIRAFSSARSRAVVRPVRPVARRATQIRAAQDGGLILTPPEAFELASANAEKVVASPIMDRVVMGIMGGIYVAIGGYLSLAVGGNVPAMASANPGAAQALFGSIGLPLGLLLCVLNKAFLFTGNVATLTAGLADRKIGFGAWSGNLIFSAILNQIGGLIVCGLALASGAPSSVGAIAIVEKKAKLTMMQAFLRAIFANWLVCTAVWWANASKDLVSKGVIIWFCVVAFASIGFEHSVANMFILPFGMALGANMTVTQFLMGNMLPVLLGNLVGGAMLVSLPFAFLYGSHRAPAKGSVAAAPAPAAVAPAAAPVAVPQIGGANTAALARAQEAVAEPRSGRTVWADLMAANRAYATGVPLPVVDNLTPDVRKNLATKGQYPSAIIVCCADSRVPPEVLFQESIGKLFVVRCAGNVVSDFSALGSIEFGVAALKAPLVVVLGHSKCGAVTGGVAGLADNGASLPAEGDTGGLRDLLVFIGDNIKEVKDKNPDLPQDELVTKAISHNAVKSAEVIKASPVISAALNEGKVEVMSAVYDLETGLVTEVGAADAPSLTTGSMAALVRAQEAVPEPRGGDAIWADLQTANREYASGRGRAVVDNLTPEVRRNLASKGQYPSAIIVCCADSRVPPEVLFQESIGKLFVVRCAGNVVSDFAALGSIEFGVAALKAPLVVVLGHSKCGAVTGGVNGLEDSSSLPEDGSTGGLRDLLEYIGENVKAVKESNPHLPHGELVDKAIAHNAQQSAKVISESPVIAGAMSEGKVKIMSAVYDLESGLVTAV